MKHAEHSAPKASPADRRRQRLAACSVKRVQVTVASRDVLLLKAIASVLRSGGEEAERIREALRPILSFPKAKTGEELVAFFRASPLVGAELQIDRDPSKGTP